MTATESSSSQFFRALSLGRILGADDVKEIYRRTLIGPFWITVSLGLQVFMIGAVFSLIFAADLKTYIPYVAVSLVLWNWISQTINNGCEAFLAAEPLMRQLPLPKLAFVVRVLWKQTFIFAHNALIIPVVFLVFNHPLTLPLMFLPLTLVLLIVNLGWVVAIVALLNARFRDVAPIVQTLTTMAFYISPVIWMAEDIPIEYQRTVLWLNPVFHLMEVVRAPILGQAPNLLSTTTLILVAVLGWGVAYFLLAKYDSRVIFWV